MFELIDQSPPDGFDRSQLLICTYRCLDCGASIKAHSINKAEMLHRKCPAKRPPVPAAEAAQSDEVQTLRNELAEMRELLKAQAKPKRGRPKKAEEPSPA